jgi:predicted MFS family arabinose efflux permease
MTTSWSRIALLYALGVLAAGQLGIVPPLVPDLKHDLGLSLAVAGTAVSVITLVGAVLGLPAGGWSQRIGHARALAIGLAIMAVGAALCAAASDATTLLAGRTLAGIGYLLVVVAGPSLMAMTAAPRHQPIALSLWGTFVPTGIALAGLVTAAFTDAGWRTIFAVDLVLLAGAVIVAVVAVPNDRSVGREDQKPPAGALTSSLPLAFAFFCFALLFLAVAGLLPAWLVERRGLAAADAGRIAAIATAFGIAGSLLAGSLMRAGVPPGRLAAIGLLGSMALAALCFTVLPLPLAVVGFALSFAIGGLVPAATFASVPVVAASPRAIGPINGLVAQAGSLGSLAGPPLLALWVDWTSWPFAPLLLLTIAVLGAASALAVRRASPPP